MIGMFIYLFLFFSVILVGYYKMLVVLMNGIFCIGNGFIFEVFIKSSFWILLGELV